MKCRNTDIVQAVQSPVAIIMAHHMLKMLMGVHLSESMHQVITKALLIAIMIIVYGTHQRMGITATL